MGFAPFQDGRFYRWSLGSDIRRMRSRLRAGRGSAARCLLAVSMITMQLLALCLLLCAAPAWGVPEERGHAEQESYLKEPSDDLQESLDKPSLLEEKLVAHGEEVLANVSSATNGPDLKEKPLTEEKPPIQDEEKLESPFQGEDKEEVKPSTQTMEVGNSPTQDEKVNDEEQTSDKEAVKPLTRGDEEDKPLIMDEEKEVVKSLMQDEGLTPPAQDKKVTLLTQDDEEDEVVKAQTQAEQEKSLTEDKDEKSLTEDEDEEEEVTKHDEDNEEEDKSLNQDEDKEEDTKLTTEDEKPLIQDEEEYNKKVKSSNQTGRKPQEDPEGKLPNLVNKSKLQVDVDIMSILQDEDKDIISKLQEKEEDTMLIFENGEDTTSKSQDEDNTMLIFQEEEDSIPSLEEDNTVLILQEHYDDTEAGLLEDDKETTSDNQDDDTIFILQEQDNEAEPDLQEEDDDTVFDQQDDKVSDQDDAYGATSDLQEEGDITGDDTELAYEDESSQEKASASNPTDISRFLSKDGSESSHFFAYLAATAIIVVLLYAVYHNNRKIINFVMERRFEAAWRPTGADYQSLDNKV